MVTSFELHIKANGDDELGEADYHGPTAVSDAKKFLASRRSMYLSRGFTTAERTRCGERLAHPTNGQRVHLYYEKR